MMVWALLNAGERPVSPDNLKEQPLSPKDESIVSENASPDAVITGPSRDGIHPPESSVASGEITTAHPISAYAPHGQTFHYGAFDGSTGTWDGYPHYVSADSLQVMPPVIFNDNSSLVFHTDYGFNSQMAYGQYSPVATPLPSIMVDCQLYSPQQIPFSPPYYPQSVSPTVAHISAAAPVPQNELMVPESSGQDNTSDNLFLGPGSGYFLQFGSFGGDLSGNSSFYNPLGELRSADPLSNHSNPSDVNRPPSTLSPGAYTQPLGILGSYEHNISTQQRSLHGLGLVSGPFSKHYPHGSSYPTLNFGGTSISRSRANERNRFSLDKSRRRERDRDSICISSDFHDIASDRNRGPRASKSKDKSNTDQDGSSTISRNVASYSGVHLDSYNQSDFATNYEDAKFFIIKSFSEDNVHKSIKYNVWASTPVGNRKLNAAFSDAKETKGNCPVFLLFSVNASAQFCGVAEMVGPVDFEKDADYWQQDRWSGQFPLQWHIVKDIPNSQFRHILLENNEHKPVTHSRDTQEVKLEQGIQMLKIFKDYDARTSILDDFVYYDEREKALQERKARQQARSTTDATLTPSNHTFDQMSDYFAQKLLLEDNGKDVQATERGDNNLA